MRMKVPDPLISNVNADAKDYLETLSFLLCDF